MIRGQVRDDGHRRGEHGRPGQLEAAQLQHHGVEIPVREGGGRRPQVSADTDISPRPSEHVPDQGGHRAFSVASRHGDKLPPDMRRDEVQLRGLVLKPLNSESTNALVISLALSGLKL